MIPDEELSRMRWASRRGMLELDLVLQPFVDQRYAELDAHNRARYRELMLCEDQDLFSWFLGRQLPEEQELREIVQQILEFTHAGGDGQAI